MKIKISPWLRLWHWLHALSVLGLLLTFLLRKTFLSWRTNSTLLTERFGDAGVAVDSDLAKSAAKAIRAPMWEWHYIFGWALAGLLIWRLIMALTKVTPAWKVESETANAQWKKHLKRLGLFYRAVYTALTIMAISGVVMFLQTELGLSHDTAHTIKEAHELLAWAIVAITGLHLAGLLRAELGGRPGIISRMISGGGEPSDL